MLDHDECALTADRKAVAPRRMVRPLVMESKEWLAVGKSLDVIYNAHDAGVAHYCKHRWKKLDCALLHIELAAQKARRVMGANNQVQATPAKND